MQIVQDGDVSFQRNRGNKRTKNMHNDKQIVREERGDVERTHPNNEGKETDLEPVKVWKGIMAQTAEEQKAAACLAQSSVRLVAY